MSGLRLIVGAAALAVAALPAAALVSPPALAAQGVFVEVNPNTIQAGYQVGIYASCGDDLNPASVRSGAFGELTLTPTPGSQFLAGSATVPADTRADEYRVDLTCADGATASAELFVLGMAKPTRGPDTGGGGTASAGGPPAPPVLLAGASTIALAAGLGLLLVRRATG
jgi:hypothetical protein